MQQGRNQPCYRLWLWRCSSPPRPAGALSCLSHSTLKHPGAASSSQACSSPDIQGHDFQGHRESCPVGNRMENWTKVYLSRNSEAFPLNNMVCSLHSHMQDYCKYVPAIWDVREKIHQTQFSPLCNKPQPAWMELQIKWSRLGPFWI